jgi:hypothetical protein
VENHYGKVIWFLYHCPVCDRLVGLQQNRCPRGLCPKQDTGLNFVGCFYCAALAAAEWWKEVFLIADEPRGTASFGQRLDPADKCSEIPTGQPKLMGARPKDVGTRTWEHGRIHNIVPALVNAQHGLAVLPHGERTCIVSRAGIKAEGIRCH